MPSLSRPAEQPPLVQANFTLQAAKKQKAQLWTEERAKSVINEFCMKLHLPAQYKFEGIGMDHNKTFMASITIPVQGNVITAQGEGKSKKEAQQVAAVRACMQLDNLGLLANRPPAANEVCNKHSCTIILRWGAAWADWAAGILTRRSQG